MEAGLYKLRRETTPKFSNHGVETMGKNSRTWQEVSKSQASPGIMPVKHLGKIQVCSMLHLELGKFIAQIQDITVGQGLRGNTSNLREMA